NPQFHLMHLDQGVINLSWRTLLPSITLAQLGGLLSCHALFGLTVGAIYTRPVGYPACSARPSRALHRRRSASGDTRRQPGRHFIFATGIECSYPTIEHVRSLRV